MGLKLTDGTILLLDGPCDDLGAALSKGCWGAGCLPLSRSSRRPHDVCMTSLQKRRTGLDSSVDHSFGRTFVAGPRGPGAPVPEFGRSATEVSAPEFDSSADHPVGPGFRAPADPVRPRFSILDSRGFEVSRFRVDPPSLAPRSA